MRYRVVGDQDEKVAAWVLSRIPGLELGEYPYSCLANVDRSGAIQGGVILNNYTGRDIHVHVAAAHSRWLTRDFLGELYRYIFAQLGCRRTTSLIGADNEASYRFCAGLGYTYEGTLRKIGANDLDWWVMGLLREDCKWIHTRSPKNGTDRLIPTNARLRQADDGRPIAGRVASAVHAPLRGPAVNSRERDAAALGAAHGRTAANGAGGWPAADAAPSDVSGG